MDEERILTELLELLWDELQPISIVKSDDEAVWCIELPGNEHVLLSCEPALRKLVCSTSFACSAAVQPGNHPVQEWLLMETYETAEWGGPTVGLDGDGVAVFYDQALAGLSVDSLQWAITDVLAAARRYRSLLPDAEEASAEPALLNDSDTIRA